MKPYVSTMYEEYENRSTQKELDALAEHCDSSDIQGLICIAIQLEAFCDAILSLYQAALGVYGKRKVPARHQSYSRGGSGVFDVVISLPATLEWLGTDHKPAREHIAVHGSVVAENK